MSSIVEPEIPAPRRSRSRSRSITSEENENKRARPDTSGCSCGTESLLASTLKNFTSERSDENENDEADEESESVGDPLGLHSKILKVGRHITNIHASVKRQIDVAENLLKELCETLGIDMVCLSLF